MMHIALLVFAAVTALLCGIVFGMLLMGKVADEAMKKALDEYVEEQLNKKEKHGD